MVRKYYSLYGRLLSMGALRQAFEEVCRSKGAPGLDHQTLEAFGSNLEKELAKLLNELKDKSYRSHPVKRVEIDKADGGKRKLGIPTVRDRVVQQAVRHILEPLFDVDFHPSSYGYRKGRSCHHAISKAQLFIRKYKREWIVDMDLSKCFDLLNHDFIISQLREKVTDSSILNLIRIFLESGVMVSGNFEATEIGSPQGGVISPLLANIYLDKFDQFMKNRNYRIVRYADDILILCGSEKSAKHALDVAENYLENEMLLKVNQTKTHIAHSSSGVKFLGVKIFTKYTQIQEQKLKAFKEKVKLLTRKTGGVNLASVIRKLNPVIRGFSNYFRVANCKTAFKNMMSWIRRRLRAVQLSLWKKPTRLRRRLRQLGISGGFYFMAMSKWRTSKSKQASMAMPNKWFHEELKLYNMGTVETGFTISVI
jgi:RNA-directed DNA polymerase